jgi:hypothetical protein
MKLPQFPHFHRPKIDLHSVALQTGLELAAGAIAFVALLRWMEM